MSIIILWWRREKQVESWYVDDCNVRLKRTDKELFYPHLDSIDVNIQFTIDLVSQTDKLKS